MIKIVRLSLYWGYRVKYLNSRTLCKTRVTLNLFQGLLQKIDVLAFKDNVVTDAETSSA
jgi:hypothetical protein